MYTDNPSLPTYNHADNAQQELQQLQDTFSQSVEHTRSKESVLLHYVSQVQEKQQHWLDRLMLTKEEKSLITVHSQKQLEAVDILLGEQNKSLKAIAEANVRFVQEVCNSLLLAGRSGMQTAVRSIYRENALQLNTRMEALNMQFWDLIETKLQNAGSRPDIVQQVIYKQVELMLLKWNEQYELILEEFNQLLNEKV
ncbi:MAG: hypothetical protein JNK77_17900 [Saprospiraceae bacterium]|nr:hypothetical protein [Saprospiraceae bacterium]